MKKLKTPLYLVLALMFFSIGTQVLAKHEANEPSDGSVDSFRWLKSPLPVSAVAIHDRQGKMIALSQFKGKIVLLNIWASWCQPCIRELPALDRLQQRLGGDDFEVVVVSIDSDPELARQMFSDQLSLQHLQLYLEPAEQLGKSFPVDVLPSSFFLDRQGQAMGLLRSYVEWDAPLADRLIKRLIDGVEASTLSMEKQQREPAQ